MSSPQKRQATWKRKRPRGRVPAWAALSGGIVLGLSLSVILLYGYIGRHGHPGGGQADTAARHPRVPPPQVTSIHARDKSTPAVASPQAPHFDFYTMLPKLKVFIPEPRDETPESPAVHGAEIDGQGTYALQVGSFRHLADADRVKAQLALIGVEADIYTVKVNEDTWHRLRVGPYSNADKLRKITARLRRNHVGYMVLKLN